MYLGQLFNADSELFEHLNLNEILERDVNIEIGKLVKFLKDEHFERNFFPPISVQGIENVALETNAAGLLYSLDHFKCKALILSDEPGMGKSTEFKFLANELKKKLPSHWIEIVDLKTFYKTYERDGMVIKQFYTKNCIANYFCQEILKIENFEAKVFKQLLTDGKVIFLMDGFDEISPSFKEFNLVLFGKILESTENMLWVSTRPHLEAELINKFKVLPHKIKQLTLGERTEFIRHIFKKKKVDGIVADVKVKEIEHFLSDLSRNGFDPFGVTNPIILRTVVNIFENDPNAKLMQASYYSIYQGFVNKMIHDCMKKGIDAQNDSAAFIENSVNIMKVYQQAAFRAVFNTQDVDINNLIDSCFFNSVQISTDTLARIGLMTADGSGRFHFIHLTFADYFVAKFLLEKVFASKNCIGIAAPILKLLKIILIEPMLRMIRVFVDSGIEKQSSDLIFIQNMFSQNFSPSELCRIFRNSAQEGSISFARVISKHFTSDPAKLNFLWLFKVDERLYPNAFLQALKAEKSMSFLEQLLALAREDLDDLSYKKLFLDVDITNLNIFYLAVQNKSGIEGQGYFEFFLTNSSIPLLDEEKLEFLRAKTVNGRNLITHAICTHNAPEVPRILKLIKAKFGFYLILDILKEDFSRGNNKNTWEWLFEWVSQESVMKNFLNEMLENFTRQENKEIFFTNEPYIANTIEGAAKSAVDVNSLKTFWEFFENVLSDMAERRNFLMHERFNLAAFNFSTMNANEKVFDFVRNKYSEFLNNQNMIKLLLKENVLRENILFLSCSTPGNDKTVAAVWKYMQTLLDSKKLKQMLLHRNVNGLLFPQSYENNSVAIVPKAFEEFIKNNLSEKEKSLFIVDQNSENRLHITIRQTFYSP